MRLARIIKQYVYEHDGKVYKATVYWYSTGEQYTHWTRLSNGQEIPLADADAPDVKVFHTMATVQERMENEHGPAAIPPA